MSDASHIVKSHAHIPLNNEKKEYIHLFESFPKNKTNLPVIIFVHGTTGSGSDGRRWRIRLAEKAAKEKFYFALFDHRCCGYSDGEFEDTTVTKRIEDLAAVTRYIRSERADLIDPNQMGLFGYSLGSAIIVLLLGNNTIAEELNIQSALLYTVPCKMKERYPFYFASEFEDAPQEKVKVFLEDKCSYEDVLYLPISKEFLRLGFLQDLENHNVCESIKNIDIGIKVIQPKDDDQVKEEYTKEAIDGIKNIEFYSMDGTHTFEGNKEQEEEVINLTLKWFHEKIFTRTPSDNSSEL